MAFIWSSTASCSDSVETVAAPVDDAGVGNDSDSTASLAYCTAATKPLGFSRITMRRKGGVRSLTKHIFLSASGFCSRMHRESIAVI